MVCQSGDSFMSTSSIIVLSSCWAKGWACLSFFYGLIPHHIYISKETTLMASKMAYCNCYQKKSTKLFASGRLALFPLDNILLDVSRRFSVTPSFTLNRIKKSCRSLLISSSPTSTISGYCEAHALSHHWMGWVTYYLVYQMGVLSRFFGMCC